MSEKTLIFQLNEAARLARKPEDTAALKAAALEVHKAVNRLHEFATTENMIALNGAWVRAANVLRLMGSPVETPPSGQSGFGEVEPMRAVA